MYRAIIKFIREVFKKPEGNIPLHAPSFIGNEKEYISNCINSTYVSSVGEYVDLFETKIKELTGAKYAIACVNGTSALHTGLIISGVKSNELVITQPLTFVATGNAILYTGAEPLFIDIDINTLCMSDTKLLEFLSEYTYQKDDSFCYHKKSNKKISACVPMHTFGHPAKIDKIKEICNFFNISLVEDAAESLGTRYNNIHTGRFGKAGIFSLNGNKIITSGGGGFIITDDDELGKLAKHITTQSKQDHKWNYFHDQIGYNYRLPNINAALACAQLEQINRIIKNKRELAEIYDDFFANYSDISFFREPRNSSSNYWLNSIIFKNKAQRDDFLLISNNEGIQTRPVWTLMSKLPMFMHCEKFNCSNAIKIENTLVNIPSSYRR